MKYQQRKDQEIVTMQKEFDAREAAMKKEINEMKQLINAKNTEIGKLNKSVVKLNKKCEENTKLLQSNATLKQKAIETHESVEKKPNAKVNEVTIIKNPATEFIYTINTFNNSKRCNDELNSSNFFYLNHYRTRLDVYLNGNGNGRNSHISVFFVLLKGPFDNIIQWPMPYGTIKIDLYINGTIQKTTSIESSGNVFKRPEHGKEDAKGEPQFFHHTKIPKHVPDDKIQFKVTILPENLPRSCLLILK